ncbi:formyl transferase [Amylostereum chailletii]|nr:formyl transferase [Amylostereum chailletii]
MPSSALVKATRRLSRLSSKPFHRRHNHNYAQTPRFRILFFGRDEFSCEVFKHLHAAPVPVRLLSIHRAPSHLPQQLPAPFFPGTTPPSPRNLLLTASFGWILPASLLALFAPGRKLNLHPSLLPSYRGPAPIQHAILNAERETGVSVVEMLPVRKGRGEIDAGDIWAQTRAPLPPNATFPTLRDSLAHTGGALLVSTLRKMLAGPLTPVPQTTLSNAAPTHPRAPLIRSSDLNVAFSASTASDIVRRHRALAHHKPLTAFFVSHGSGALDASHGALAAVKRVQLHDPVALPAPPEKRPRTTVPGLAYYDRATGCVAIACAGETVLGVGRLKRQDKALLGAKEWWNGEGKYTEDGWGVLRFVAPPLDG